MHFLKKLKKYFNTKEKRHQTDVFKLLITKENFSYKLLYLIYKKTPTISNLVIKNYLLNKK